MVTSAGILMYRLREGILELLLVHPGGPFWAKKDAGAWSIPKGEYVAGEDPLIAARREFREETGFEAVGEFIELTPLKQRSGKVVACWALEGDLDAGAISSNTFELEWPPHSGRKVSFPEIDRAGWFGVDAAKEKILPGQAGFITELYGRLKGAGRD
ncbi:MAG: NUDIX domain-containing protein [Actinobacteria bacterium]|nr:NUDIX domain-containing protein [Actinomycetota bacterium]MCL5883659.1 NUDIX domain-containing protein [Actinomycetota bacterium]